MDQAPPSEVYLVPEVNAWVTEVGGRGGSKRIMGLGLPLLAVLDMSQLRAVLAHEFGHYYEATRSWACLYRTRMTIGRTVKAWPRRAAFFRCRSPVRELFLRVTQKVSGSGVKADDWLPDMRLPGSRGELDDDPFRRRGSSIGATGGSCP
jgi:hypothetical protein